MKLTYIGRKRAKLVAGLRFLRGKAQEVKEDLGVELAKDAHMFATTKMTDVQKVILKGSEAFQKKMDNVNVTIDEKQEELENALEEKRRMSDQLKVAEAKLKAAEAVKNVANPPIKK